jgi:hypothetical protein
MKKACKLGLVLAGTPAVLVVGALCVLDMWLEYRRDPAAFDEMLDSFINS